MSRSHVVWHIAPNQTRTPPKGSRHHHLYAQKDAYGWLPGKLYAPNGDREVARRRRQIERGQLKAENGLVT